MPKRCHTEHSESARRIVGRHVLSAVKDPERQNSDAARRVVEVMLEEEQQPHRSRDSSVCTAAITSASAQELCCIRVDIMSRRQGVAVLFEVHACSHAPPPIAGTVSAWGAGWRWNDL